MLPRRGILRGMRDVPHGALLREGIVEPVARGGADERAWLDCDLASLAENRLGDPSGPRDLSPERRADWVARATSEGEYPLDARSYETAYWLLDETGRVGTVAVSRTAFGVRDARIASLYVFPWERGRGVGRRALARIGDALAGEGFGFRLDTSWSWGRTVRFYVRTGLWVLMWKRDLCFAGGLALPPPIIEVGAREATVSAARASGERVTLATARYDGAGALASFELCPKELGRDPELGEAYWHADSTLALALALAGRSLVRSPEVARQVDFADGGPPEALARRIPVWEAWEREHGWRVDAPRIPGLAYPTWAELEARWAREEADGDDGA